MQKQQDNSWHDRGEFPPAGCECEALYSDEWITVISVGIDSSGYCVFEVPECMNDEPPYDGIHEQARFRPLRTEREKAIDAACEAIGGVISGRLIIERLYDAGLLKQ